MGWTLERTCDTSQGFSSLKDINRIVPNYIALALSSTSAAFYDWLYLLIKSTPIYTEV